MRPAAGSLEAAFAAEELAGLRLAARTRAALLVLLAVWITIENPFPRYLFIYPFLIVFALVGYAPLWLRLAGIARGWLGRALPVIDAALLVGAVFAPTVFDSQRLPVQMQLRFDNELYLFLLVVSAVFTYSPWIVWWTSVATAAVWSVVTVVILLRPDSVVTWSSSVWRSVPNAELVPILLDPHRVNPGLWGREVVVLTLAGAALAVFVRRARQLVERQAAAERERANLSRYFSPNMVDELAQSDTPLGATRQQDVAVLFVDIVGFTRLAESLPPTAVIALLRDFHERMQRIVFARGGTVDKYIGDAVMVTFGTPHPGPADATNALGCVGAMLAAVDAWNDERARRGEAPVRIGVGSHFGPVVLGDIGGESRLEFAVLGDTVNVAQRLERLTRALGTPAVVSDALVATARREGEVDQLLSGFTSGPPQTLRGREGAMAVWVWARPAPPAGEPQSARSPLSE